MHIVACKMKYGRAENHFRGRHPLFKQEQRRILGADAGIEWRVWTRIDVSTISKIDNVCQVANFFNTDRYIFSLAICFSIEKAWKHAVI